MQIVRIGLDLAKRGDRYLRTLMIHGARAVLGKVGGKRDPRSRWIGRMRERRHPNVVAVALANKNARIVWAVLSGEKEYRPAPLASAALYGHRKKRSSPRNIAANW